MMDKTETPIMVPSSVLCFQGHCFSNLISLNDPAR